VEHNRKLEKELKQKAASSSKELAVTLVDQVEQVGHTPVLAAVVDAMNMDALRGLLDHLRPKIPSGVIVLGSASEGKASFVAAVSDDHVAAGIHAGQLIGAIAKIAGGGGGGQPGKAQAGGKDPAKVPEAIAATKDLIRRMIESKAS
jgi:alanyl-tRNA synthetase